MQKITYKIGDCRYCAVEGKSKVGILNSDNNWYWKFLKMRGLN